MMKGTQKSTQNLHAELLSFNSGFRHFRGKKQMMICCKAIDEHPAKLKTNSKLHYGLRSETFFKIVTILYAALWLSLCSNALVM